MDALIQIIILIYSAILHEISHGWVAYRLGDPTAKVSKRLTLNPISHIDPIFTLTLPIFLLLFKSPVVIGGAKPVPIDPYNFQNPKKDIALTAAAGPITNFFLALVFGTILKFLEISGMEFAHPLLAESLFSGVLINIMLAFFNLLPIPPLDGYKVVGGIIPDKFDGIWLSFERLGFLILLPILFLLDHTLVNSFGLLSSKLITFFNS